jgi:NOL1/NOP2/sun family putative RNA methylase
MKTLEPKPLFVERMKKLLGRDFESYMKILKKDLPRSIRVNKLKISPEELRKKLEEKKWIISQPFKNYPEVMIVKGKIANKKIIDKGTNEKDISINSSRGGGRGSGGSKLIALDPGELGRSLEHQLGYYYVQEIASMLPIIALQPKPEEIILDLCSAPGSKTTQIAAEMKNTGTIIANEISLKRIKILASNLEKSGVMNTIITKKEGTALCKKLKEQKFFLDKILVDAPCSGEGTLRSKSKTYKMWNINTVKKLSKIQKSLIIEAIKILKPEGEILYSTCTHAPEENEEVIDFVLKEFKDQVKIEEIRLPIKCRDGVSGWVGKKYSNQIAKSCRIYPQDNDTEGFFLAKLKRVK